jgi:hypothetical protein
MQSLLCLHLMRNRSSHSDGDLQSCVLPQHTLSLAQGASGQRRFGTGLTQNIPSHTVPGSRQGDPAMHSSPMSHGENPFFLCGGVHSLSPSLPENRKLAQQIPPFLQSMLSSHRAIRLKPVRLLDHCSLSHASHCVLRYPIDPMGPSFTLGWHDPSSCRAQQVSSPTRQFLSRQENVFGSEVDRGVGEPLEDATATGAASASADTAGAALAVGTVGAGTVTTGRGSTGLAGGFAQHRGKVPASTTTMTTPGRSGRSMHSMVAWDVQPMADSAL